MKFLHQICNWQHFIRKLQSNLFVKKACQRLIELGKQGSIERRKICESAGYSIRCERDQAKISELKLQYWFCSITFTTDNLRLRSDFMVRKGGLI